MSIDGVIFALMFIVAVAAYFREVYLRTQDRAKWGEAVKGWVECFNGWKETYQLMLYHREVLTRVVNGEVTDAELVAIRTALAGEVKQGKELTH